LRPLPGVYHVEWVNPSSGTVIASTSLDSKGGDTVLETPRYFVDIALRMKRLPQSAGANCWTPPRVRT